MIDAETEIKEIVLCCACSGSLKNSNHINVICLDKEATWSYPCWGNILVHDKHPLNRASAILCDKCMEKNRQPKYAVEWSNDYRTVKYHPLQKLKDVPKILEKDILEAEARLCGVEVEG